MYVSSYVPDKSAEAGSSLDIVSGNKMFDFVVSNIMQQRDICKNYIYIYVAS